GPGGDQIGKIHAYRCPCPRRGAVTAALDINLVAAQIKVLSDVIKKQIDRWQGDRLRRKLIVGRPEADLYLLRERRRQISFKSALIVSSSALITPLHSFQYHLTNSAASRP